MPFAKINFALSLPRLVRTCEQIPLIAEGATPASVQAAPARIRIVRKCLKTMAFLRFQPTAVHCKLPPVEQRRESISQFPQSRNPGSV